LLVVLTKLGYFSEAVFNPATEVCILGLRCEELGFRVRMAQLNVERVQFLGDSCSGLKFPDPPADRPKLVPVALLNLGGSLAELSFKTSPDVLLVVLVLLLEQPEGLLRAELRDSCEILRAKPVQNLGASEHARSRAQRAFDGFCRQQNTSFFIGQFVLR